MKRALWLVAALLATSATGAPEGPDERLPGDYRPGELLVKFKAGAAPMGKALLGRKGGAETRRFAATRIEHWRLPPGSSLKATLEELRASGAVEFAEPNYRRYPRYAPDDPDFEKQWALRNHGQAVGKYSTVRGKEGADMSVAEAWVEYPAAATATENVVLAIIDDSVEIDHPDLVENLWTNVAEQEGTPDTDDDGNGFVDDLHGWDFVSGDNDPSAAGSHEGHGTAVAGCAGARGNNGKGIAGVAPQVRIMALKFNMDVATELQAVDYAIAHGAHIVNASWGGPDFSVAENDAVKKLEEAGILLVAAAGNEGLDNDLIRDYPSSLPNANVIAVGASNIDDGVITWSQFGQTTVDLFAPGEHIYTTRTDPPGYGYTQGTSFSAPYVSGIAALLKAQFPEATAPELRGRLLAGAQKMAVTGAATTDGRADALASLEATPAPVVIVAAVAVNDGADGNGRLDPGESVELEVTLENAWRDATGVTATLTTTDKAVTVADGTAEYGALPGLGGTAKRTFRVALAAGATGHRRIPFKLSVQADGIDEQVRHFALETGRLQPGVIHGEVLEQNPRDRMHLFHVEVPQGTRLLRVDLNAKSDVDLALRAGAIPEYHPCYRDGFGDCVGEDTRISARSGGDESISIDSPTPGTYFVLVTNQSASTNVNYELSVSLGEGGGGSGAWSPLALLPLGLLAARRGRRLGVALLVAAGLVVAAGCQTGQAVAEGPQESWLVTFEAGTDRAAARRLLEGQGARILHEYRMQPTYQVTVPGDGVEGLRRLPGVVAVERNVRRGLRSDAPGDPPN